MGLFGTYYPPKNTRAKRIAKLKAKVKKLTKQKAMKTEEEQLRRKYETLKRNS